MSGNDDLKSAAPHLLCQLHAHLVGNLRRDLPMFKTLEAVVTDNLAGIVPLRLGDHHFLSGCGGIAVHTADEKTLLGLVLVGGILHHVHHRLQVAFAVLGVGGLFRVLGIVDGVVEPAFHIPYLAHRH